MYKNAQKVLRMLNKIISENKWIRSIFSKVIEKINTSINKFSGVLKSFFGSKKLHESAADDNSDDAKSKKSFGSIIKKFLKGLIKNVFDSLNLKNAIKTPGTTLKTFFTVIIFVLVFYGILTGINTLLLKTTNMKEKRVRFLLLGIPIPGDKATSSYKKSIASVSIIFSITAAESLIKSALRYYLLQSAETEEDKKAIKFAILVLRALSALVFKKKFGTSFVKVAGVSMITDAFENEFHLSIENKWQAIGLGSVMEFIQISNTKKNIMGIYKKKIAEWKKEHRLELKLPDKKKIAEWKKEHRLEPKLPDKKKIIKYLRDVEKFASYVITFRYLGFFHDLPYKVKKEIRRGIPKDMDFPKITLGNFPYKSTTNFVKRIAEEKGLKVNEKDTQRMIKSKLVNFMTKKAWERFLSILSKHVKSNRDKKKLKRLKKKNVPIIF